MAWPKGVKRPPKEKPDMSTEKTKETPVEKAAPKPDVKTPDKTPSAQDKTPSAKSLDDLVKDIKQQKAPEPKAEPKAAPEPGEPSREAMLAHLAKEYNTTPAEVAKMLQVGEPVRVQSPVLETPDPGGKRVPVLLKRDYWAPDYLGEVNADGNRRVTAGAVLHLPIPEAKRLIASGVAERADAFPED